MSSADTESDEGGVMLRILTRLAYQFGTGRAVANARHEREARALLEVRLDALERRCAAQPASAPVRVAA
jgi:hypothetical protein